MTDPTPWQKSFGDSDVPVAMGTLRGIRTWKTKLSLRGVQLHGQFRGTWSPGVNTSECLATWPCEGLDLDCACGYYAYWRIGPHVNNVLGVVEGWGKTITGRRGFRCEKAQIIAMTLVMPQQNRTREEKWLCKSYPNVPLFRTHGEMIEAFPPTTPPDNEMDEVSTVALQRISTLIANANTSVQRISKLMHPPSHVTKRPSDPYLRASDQRWRWTR